MASLEIELCGPLADLAGRTIILCDFAEDGLPASEVLAKIATAWPLLGSEIAKARVKLCVDETIVGGDAVVRPGALVALFPPVSGG